jgi:hypothetical protein
MYKEGNNWVICDRTGFKVRASECQKEWNGLFVRKKSYEERQPQDFPPDLRDSQLVPNPRPRTTDVFLSDNQVTADSL